MANAHRRNGSGYLILNDGTQASVAWEIELGPNNTLHGVVRGNPSELARAAEDRYVILQLEASEQFSIEIASAEDDTAFFIRHYNAHGWFDAKAIVGSTPTESGDRFMIAFASALGDEFKVLVPTVILRDYLPVLENTLPPASPGEPPASFFRVPETFSTGALPNYRYVYVKFGNDQPVALAPESAYDLAKDLLELAKQVAAKWS